MKPVFTILGILAMVIPTIWLAYYTMFSPRAKHQGKLADAKIRKMIEDARRHSEAEEASVKAAINAEVEEFKQQMQRLKVELAARRQSAQEERAAVDAEIDRVIESVSDPKIKARLRRDLDWILPPDHD